MCRLDEWDSLGGFYNYSWGILDKFGECSVAYYLNRLFYLYFCPTNLFLFTFKPKLAQRSLRSKRNSLSRYWSFLLNKDLGRGSSLLTLLTLFMEDPFILLKPNDSIPFP